MMDEIPHMLVPMCSSLEFLNVNSWFLKRSN